MQLSFLGAVGGQKLLIDCGMFQGFKPLRLRNWAALPVDPASIDAVVLTHAHLDHSGYAPCFVRSGFNGRIFATDATCDLCGVLWPDSGYLQELDAEFANRHGISKHHPALPLYTKRAAIDALERLKPTAFNKDVKIGKEISVRFLPAGHILGAAMVRVETRGKTLLFSGDLGRKDNSTMPDPMIVRDADYLIVESTYGNRSHDGGDAEAQIAGVVNRAAGRGGTILIPSFAVGRAQSVLYYLDRLKQEKRIPDLPIYLDSPMAINASEIFCHHLDDHRLTAAQCRDAFGRAVYVREAADSKTLNANSMPKIIISASGMATGGRVLHHLKILAPDPKNAILFTGFQAGGTRGASITEGADSVKIHGSYIPIRAEVDNLHMLSAHADADGILDWLGNFATPPKQTFITHGEPAASDALRIRIEESLGWDCVIPEYRDCLDLS
jgi:metallo-beta-lactamase family protein